ncbi:MAG: cobalamin-dependent protein [Pirellulales bacterium]|nr:cobalamin-dependent protein [Pirellulales bacterium]
MNHLPPTSARMIHHAAHALAGYAAEEFVQSRPELAGVVGEDAFPAWQNLLTDLLEDLAAVLAVDRPRLFVEYVRWMRSLLGARCVPDEAIASGLDCLRGILLAELPADAAAPAADACRQAIETLRDQTYSISDRPLDVDSPQGRLAGEYLLALLSGDEHRATDLVLRAADEGHSVPDLYLNVLLPAQEEVGRMWQQDDVSIAEEHLVTAATKRVFARLRDRAARKTPNGRTALAAAVAGNRHDVGLCAVADFLEMDGWRVVQLGADVPVADLAQAVELFEADLLCVSASQHAQLESLRQTLGAVRRGPRGAAIKILVGGRALVGADDLAVEFGADAVAADPAQAVSLGNALVGLPNDSPS